MIELRQRKEFLIDFMEELEEKAIKAGSYQIPFWTRCWPLWIDLMSLKFYFLPI
ncbi:MAG: hypothetical protein K0S80_2206 [Neobacillus sp.]|nr:hypothetical protein [Neobacillus sp.]